MRICQVLAGNEDGGLEKHTIELSKQLKERGFDVSVIAHDDFAPFFKDISFIPLNLSKSRNNPIILYKLYKILKNEKFDLVHTQASKATDMVIKLKPFLSSKIVSTLHSYKKNISSFEKSDFVITVSNKISERLKNSNHQTIYNGIKYQELKLDESVFGKYSIPKDKFLICSVGRLCDVKRFDILISSLKNLDVFCVLVGDGERKKELQALAKRLDINHRILFTGNIENQEVKKLINISNLFVITSDKEGFPYVFVESLLGKTPVISTDVSDIKDIISENNIFNFNDINNLTEKIKQIKNNYNDVLLSYTNIFEYASRTFTLDNMVNETISIYKKVLV